MDSKKEEHIFNVYYLNFSKVYEISMMINNKIPETITHEKTDEKSGSNKIGASLNADYGSEFLAKIKSEIGFEKNESYAKNSKMVELLNVKTTKSTLLRRIKKRCHLNPKLDSSEKGNLVKLDNIELKILDEENNRMVKMIKANALEGINSDSFEGMDQLKGVDFNNLISALVSDYSYLLFSEIDTTAKDGKSSSNKVAIKVPMNLNNEFENDYNIYDLLLGKVSIIGIYKGIMDKKSICENTMEYFNKFNLNNSEQIPKSQNEKNSSEMNTKDQDNEKYAFIDIIAIIQDISFNEEIKNKMESLDKDEIQESAFKKLVNFFKKLFNRK